jgi:hypothetical protein
MLSTAQIGRCGELLVQYRLLLLGIDSAPMSTDVGIDLVAYSPRRVEPLSIQVKTNLKSKPGGGKGKAALDWWVPVDTPAQCIALVDLATERVWLLSQTELADLAQQRSSGRHHIFMYTDPTAKPRKTGRLAHVHEFKRFLLSECAEQVFG